MCPIPRPRPAECRPSRRTATCQPHIPAPSIQTQQEPPVPGQRAGFHSLGSLSKLPFHCTLVPARTPEAHRSVSFQFL
ncbi:MAG: hypothetical protein H6678_14080 [Candidatus Delongbacteria bacterium]|nr:hypothetical protein [Candidatus Delongbacteria bacterium]